MSRKQTIAVLAAGGLCGLVLSGSAVYGLLIVVERSAEADARLGIAKIQTAVVAYHTKHGEYPPNLKVFTEIEGSASAYLLDKDLIDPWGKPYRYEPTNCHPVTGRPKISTTTPKGVEISNWDE
jgi:hypothetical protein